MVGKMKQEGKPILTEATIKRKNNSILYTQLCLTNILQYSMPRSIYHIIHRMWVKNSIWLFMYINWGCEWHTQVTELKKKQRGRILNYLLCGSSSSSFTFWGRLANLIRLKDKCIISWCIKINLVLFLNVLYPLALVLNIGNLFLNLYLGERCRRFWRNEENSGTCNDEG